MDSFVGQTLCGRWHVLGELGQGGMSTVYSGNDPSGASIAIKVLNGELGRSTAARERFLRERRAADLIGHPGVVRVLDHGETNDGRLVLVMELLEGRTLGKACSLAGGKLDVEEVMRMADSVLDALSAAHTRRVVHRDIKPDNIFLTTDGAVKVLDFGVAAMRDDGFSQADVTKSGATLGTPAFMAPEQARGHHARVDARTDVWAVGATMFFCLTGRHVHAEASTANEALIFAATQSAPPLAKFRPDIGRHIATVIDRALAFSPDDRWQSAQAMREAITSAHANVDGVSVPPSHRTIATLEDSSSSLVSKSPGRRRAHLAAVAVTSLGLAGVLGNYARSTRATTANAEVTPSLGHIDEAPRAVPNPPTPFEDPARLAPAPAVEESSNVSPLGDRNAAEKVVASPPHRPKTAKGSATSGAPKPARGFPAGDTAAESLLDRRNLRPAWVGTDSPGDGAEASLDRRK